MVYFVRLDVFMLDLVDLAKAFVFTLAFSWFILLEWMFSWLIWLVFVFMWMFPGSFC